jgi:hypothetical protein
MMDIKALREKWTKVLLWEYILLLNKRREALSGFTTEKGKNALILVVARFEQMINLYNYWYDDNSTGSQEDNG